MELARRLEATGRCRDREKLHCKVDILQVSTWWRPTPARATPTWADTGERTGGTSWRRHTTSSPGLGSGPPTTPCRPSSTAPWTSRWRTRPGCTMRTAPLLYPARTRRARPTLSTCGSWRSDWWGSVDKVDIKESFHHPMNGCSSLRVVINMRNSCAYTLQLSEEKDFLGNFLSISQCWMLKNPILEIFRTLLMLVERLRLSVVIDWPWSDHLVWDSSLHC